MPRMLPRRLTMVVAALLLLPATSASAATVAYDGGVLVYSATDGDDAVDIDLGTDGGPVTIDSLSDIQGPAPAGCDVAFGKATCAVDPALGVRVLLLAGNDVATFRADNQRALPVTVDGGAGNDNLSGTAFAGGGETLAGGPGDDTLAGYDGRDTLSGGDGNDVLSGDAGADVLDGGAGDDRLVGDGTAGRSADVIDGGPGHDTLEDWALSADAAPIAVTLGAGADDGFPGEGDDVRGVETVTTSSPGRITGTDDRDELFATNGAVTLEGRGGDDELRSGSGADVLDGGAGADKLVGGAGDDRIVGGPGRDTVLADVETAVCGKFACAPGSGNDVIEVRDGEADSVECGPGTDRVVADAADVIAPDCEQVDRGTVTGRPPGDGGKPDDPVVTSAKVRVARTSLRTALAKGLKVTLTGVAKGRRTLVAQRGRTVVARRAVQVPASGKAVVRLKFSAKARRQLKRTRKVKLVVRVGSASTQVTLRR